MSDDDEESRLAPASASEPIRWSDLLRGLRHELRTPINHIIGYSELLLEVADERGHAALLADLEKIRAAGAELGTLVNESLDAARLQTALPDTTSLSRDLRTPLNTIVGYSELLEEEAEENGYADLLPDLQRIRTAGRHLLSQVHALLDLAEDLGEDDPEDPEDRSVPAAPAAAVGVAARPPTVQPEHPRVERPVMLAAKLLVVDDDEANRDMLSRRLERLGYQVALAEDGREALDKIADEPFDLILLDIVMPELDGYAVLLRLKADESRRHIPVIVLSASDELDTAVRCIELGAEDYLPKPIDAVLLRARIGACLEKKYLHDQEQRHLETIEGMAAELADWNRTLEQRVAEQTAQLDRVGRLKRFLPVRLAEMIVATGDESILESHRRQIAIVFCDLRGFTPFSEAAEPEEVMEVLAEFHTGMGELISHYEGTVEHFAGDGMMVVFNDPFPCPDPEIRAVRMAVQMRARMAELGHAWLRRGFEVGFGVGISLGYATLGQIGFEGRFHYAAIGNIVNLAHRLCGEAKDGQILVSRRVGLAVEEVAEVASAGSLALKGFRDPVPAFEIVALKDT
ncbi:MAG TPA: response regulator [Chloroflexota bacterium]|nr:response regulator [Chloroflexota bacterium]